MKLIELCVLICFFSFFFFYQRVEVTSHTPVSFHSKIIKKNTNTRMVISESIQEMETHNYVLENEPELSPPEMDFEFLWKDDVYVYLQEADPHHADDIFRQFEEEDLRHQENLNSHLITSINGLSSMNGESGYDNSFGGVHNPALEDPYQLEIQHQKKVKKILGENYQYIKERESLKREDSEF